MGTPDSDLERLLHAAARADEPAATAPFGFDTRVVALWRSGGGERSFFANEFARLLRRVAIGAAVLMAVATVGAYWQVTENEDESEPLTNAYAIADSAIDSGWLQ